MKKELLQSLANQFVGVRSPNFGQRSDGGSGQMPHSGLKLEPEVLGGADRG
jgi:hypothetical protein